MTDKTTVLKYLYSIHLDKYPGLMSVRRGAKDCKISLGKFKNILLELESEGILKFWTSKMGTFIELCKRDQNF